MACVYVAPGAYSILGHTCYMSLSHLLGRGRAGKFGMGLCASLLAHTTTLPGRSMYRVVRVQHGRRCHGYFACTPGMALAFTARLPLSAHPYLVLPHYACAGPALGHGRANQDDLPAGQAHHRSIIPPGWPRQGGAGEAGTERSHQRGTLRQRVSEGHCWRMGQPPDTAHLILGCDWVRGDAR